MTAHDHTITNGSMPPTEPLFTIPPARGPGAPCACGREDCVIPEGKRAHATHASPACRQAAYRKRTGGESEAARSQEFWRRMGAIQRPAPRRFQRGGSTNGTRRAQKASESVTTASTGATAAA
jgi:hypothetical protein